MRGDDCSLARAQVGFMCHTIALCMQLYLRCLHPSQLRAPSCNDAPPQQNRSWAAGSEASAFRCLAKRRSVPTFLAHVRNHWFAARRMSCQISTTRCANANQPMLRDSLQAQTTPRCGAVQLRRVSQRRAEPPQDSEIW